MESPILGVRLPGDLKERFIKKCESEDISPSHAVKKCVEQLCALSSWQLRLFLSFGIQEYLSWREQEYKKMSEKKKEIFV